MQRERFEPFLDKTKTTVNANCKSGKFCGIAIGPDSRIGQVRANGMLLQAGRVLPLAAESYELVRTVGLPASSVKFTASSQLEVLLFEDPAEMACEMSRPNQRYSVGNVAAAGGGYTLEVIRVPFSGRRVALFVVRNTTAIAAYRVRAVSWADLAGTVGIVQTVVVVEQIGAVPASGTTALAFYLGGTDHGEVWEELILDIDGGTLVDVDVLCMGEMGRP